MESKEEPVGAEASSKDEVSSGLLADLEAPEASFKVAVFCEKLGKMWEREFFAFDIFSVKLILLIL